MVPTLKELRENKNWSQQELSQRAIVAQVLVSRAETGKPIGRTTFLRLCMALGANPDTVTGVVFRTRS